LEVVLACPLYADHIVAVGNMHRGRLGLRPRGHASPHQRRSLGRTVIPRAYLRVCPSAGGVRPTCTTATLRGTPSSRFSNSARVSGSCSGLRVLLGSPGPAVELRGTAVSCGGHALGGGHAAA